MSAIWTQQKILALAPDASSAKNGQALATPHNWLSLGYNEQAVWGKCRGSGDNLYETLIDLRKPTFKCTCSSRKYPCKHAIGLFLLLESQKTAFSENIPSQSVSQWLNARDQKKDTEPTTDKMPTPQTEKTEKVVDTTAGAKRAQQRYNKVVAGMQDLELWLRDLVRQGLAEVQAQPYSFWDTVAARLVDAQAPGVARWVRDLAGIPYTGIGWQERLLAQLGRIYLLVEGFKRLESLPVDLQADIRTQIGWTQNQEELLTLEGVRDSWLILGQRVSEEDKLRVQRTWLWGKETQRAALILNFAYGSQPLDTSLVPGTCIEGELVFFQSAYPLRALVKTRDAVTQVDTMPGYNTISEMMQAYAQALSRNPWIEQFPVALRAVIPAVNQDGICRGLFDCDSHLLPTMGINSQQGWQLLAYSGGHEIGIFGEWNGDRFLPLSVFADNYFASL